MDVVISEGGPKKCDSCGKAPLPEFFTCQGCPPQSNNDSFDICSECASRYAREAHEAHRGPDHKFVFARRNRYCKWCSKVIREDFMTCFQCTMGLESYDLCLTCTMVRRPLVEHMSLQNHSMYYVHWKGPVGEVRKAQSFPLNWIWNCDGGRCGTVSPAIQDSTSFFHCLDCFGDGFDLCPRCADYGGLFRHRGTSSHRFIFVAQSKLPGEEPVLKASEDLPPPYQAW